MRVERDGITYVVRRRWVPWRWRKRDPDALGDLGDAGTSVADDLVIGVVIFLAMLVLLVVAPFVLVWLIAGLEIVMLVLLLRWTRVLRWPIDVWDDRTLVHEEAVRGWGASRLRLHEIADEVRAGRIPARRPDPDGGAD